MSRPAAPKSVEEALLRAGAHWRRAMAESIAAARALLDAAALAITGSAAGDRASLASLTHALDDLEASLAGDADARSPLVVALADALDAEIAKWERRAQRDADARAVLRAFLGLREVLWQLGVRGTAAAPPGTGAAGARSRSDSRAGAQPAGAARKPRTAGSAEGSRVQRVQVRG